MRHLGRVVAAVMFAALSIHLQASAEAWRDQVIAAVRPGAVVARRGLLTDSITQAVLLGQGGGRWSHVGIAVQLIPGGQIYIESAMPGVGTKLEKPEVFFSTEQASDGRVLPLPSDKADAAQIAAKELLGRPFDHQLRLDDDGKTLYCTKLVSIALIKAGVFQKFPTRSVKWLRQPVITPDDLVAAISHKPE